MIVWLPSDNAVVGVYVHWYPPVIEVLVIASPVTLVPLSNVMPIVAGLTPESESVTFQVITGLLFAEYDPDVGLTIVITGATFSFTFNCRDDHNVLSVASFVVVFPASSVALTVTP